MVGARAVAAVEDAEGELRGALEIDPDRDRRRVDAADIGLERRLARHLDGEDDAARPTGVDAHFRLELAARLGQSHHDLADGVGPDPMLVSFRADLERAEAARLAEAQGVVVLPPQLQPGLRWDGSGLSEERSGRPRASPRFLVRLGLRRGQGKGSEEERRQQRCTDHDLSPLGLDS